MNTCSRSSIPDQAVISLSEIHPVYTELINETVPQGVIPMRPLNVVWFL